MPTPARSLLNQLTEDSNSTTATASTTRPTNRSGRVAGLPGSREVMDPPCQPDTGYRACPRLPWPTDQPPWKTKWILAFGSGVGDLFKALADPTRRAILDELQERAGQTLFELCPRLTSRHGVGSSRQ